MASEKQVKVRRSREEWAEHLAAWERSGLGQEAYCRENGLNPTSFSAWKTKLRDRQENIPLVEIRPAMLQKHVNEEAIIELVLEGIIVRLREGIDPIRLRNIVIALAGV